MSEHYKEDLTKEEYEEQYNAAEALVFGDKVKGKVYAVLPSLEGIAEVGVGKDEQHAREDFLEKLGMLIQELDTKRVKVQYEQVLLDYTNVGEV